MTHDVVPADDAPRQSRMPMMAGGRPHAIVPQTMDDAYRLGKAICLAGMAPKGMDSPEKCMIAIMRGMEVGLTPMQALDKIAIVNGRPTIWGDGALGLVRGSGLCEYVREWIEGEGDAMVAFCEAKRRGEVDPVCRSFSVKEAKEAGLWGKAGPWQQFKRRMLAMRARAFCLRDLFADVLGGLYLKEELDNGDEDRGGSGPARRAPSPSAAPMIEHETAAPAPPSERQLPPAAAPTSPSRRAPSPSAAPASQSAAESAPEQAAPAQPAQDRYDPEKVRKKFAARAAAAKDRNDLNNAWEDCISPWQDEAMMQIGAPDRIEADRIYDETARVLDEDGR